MTASTSATVRAEIVRQAGGFLRNTIRETDVTCSVCAAPVDAGYSRCIRCHAAQDYAGELADLVGAFTYARSGHQTGTVMRGYKAIPPQQQHHLVVQLLLADGLLHHLDCATRLVGRPITCWAAVPSLTTGRPDHPLPSMVAPFVPRLARVNVVAAVDPRDPRTVRPENFLVQNDLRGHHLLIIDDTWTTGGQAQSVAVGARRMGAEAVTILTIARWLDPSWGPTERFIRARIRTRDFDADVCPFTASGCP